MTKQARVVRWPQVLMVVHERMAHELQTDGVWAKEVRVASRNGERFRCALRPYVRWIGVTSERGHCVAVIRTPDGLRVHNDHCAPFVIDEEDLTTEDGASISDQIRLGYYEKVEWGDDE
jgi:hypothetical protein